MTAALSMNDAAAKLRDVAVIRQMDPPSAEHFCTFTNYLADRLVDRDLVPQGFLVGTSLAVYDLISGTDGFTGKPINNRLIGMPPMIFHMMLDMLYRHLHLILPKDFADEVLRFHSEALAGTK